MGALPLWRLLRAPAGRAISSPLKLSRISPDGSKRTDWPRLTLTPVFVHCTLLGTTTERARRRCLRRTIGAGAGAGEPEVPVDKFGNPATLLTELM